MILLSKAFDGVSGINKGGERELQKLNTETFTATASSDSLQNVKPYLILVNTALVTQDRVTSLSCRHEQLV